MTNEEAIHELECNVDYKTPQIAQACRLAVRALEQQPSEDCISREEVLNSLKGFEILHNHDELRTNLIYGIMNLPSVTPKAESEDKE